MGASLLAVAKSIYYLKLQRVQNAVARLVTNTPSHMSHYSCFKRSRGKIVNNVIGYKVNEESLEPQLTGTTASNTIKANKVKALKIKNPPDLTTSSRSY